MGGRAENDVLGNTKTRCGQGGKVVEITEFYLGDVESRRMPGSNVMRCRIRVKKVRCSVINKERTTRGDEYFRRCRKRICGRADVCVCCVLRGRPMDESIFCERSAVRIDAKCARLVMMCVCVCVRTRERDERMVNILMGTAMGCYLCWRREERAVDNQRASTSK
jgi:hypothetical protein